MRTINMNKTISTVLAVAMLSTSLVAPASAGLVTNGGKPQYSITEIQAKINDGSFYNYPGVIRETESGIRVGPTGNKYLFSKTFAPGMALPEINDINALLKALDKKDETVLVASNEWIVPVPSVFVELGKQNGVDGITFMQHYLEGVKGVSSDDFTSFAKAQTKAVVQVLGVKSSVIVNTQQLVDQGILDELAAKTLENAMLTTQISQANTMIAELTEDNRQLVADLANAMVTIDDITAARDALIAEVDDLNDDIAVAKGIIADLNTQLDAANAAVVMMQSTIDFAITANVENARQSLRDALDRATTTANNAVQAMTSSEIVANAGSSYNNALEGGRTAQPGTLENYAFNADANGVSAQTQSINNAYAVLHTEHNTRGFVSILRGSFSGRYVIAAIQEAATEAYNEGYRDGYDAGYADGYKDGFADGSAVR